MDDSFSHFEKFIFLGRWALCKMSHNSDGSSCVISFMINWTLPAMVIINIDVTQPLDSW